MKDPQLALGVSVKDMSGADKVEFFFDALAAANIAAVGPKMKSVAGNSCIGTNQYDVDRAQLQFHARVWTEIFSRAAQRTQAAGFGAAHGNLKNGASRRVIRVEEIFRLSEKRAPEKLNRFADLLVRQLFQGDLSYTATMRRFHLGLPYCSRLSRGHLLDVMGMLLWRRAAAFPCCQEPLSAPINRIIAYCYDDW
jgi:hypothetical protein